MHQQQYLPVLLHGEPFWSYSYIKIIPILTAAGYRYILPFSWLNVPHISTFTFQNFGVLQNFTDFFSIRGILLDGILYSITRFPGNPNSADRIMDSDTLNYIELHADRQLIDHPRKCHKHTHSSGAKSILLFFSQLL